MEDLPPQNQGTSSTCYASTATQLIDAYRFSQPNAQKDHLTSTYAAAIESKENRINAWLTNLFNDGYDKDGSRLGDVCEAFNAVKSNGSCDHDYFDKEMRHFNQVVSGQPFTVSLELIAQFEELFAELRKSPTESLSQLNQWQKQLSEAPCSQKYVNFRSTIFDQKERQFIGDTIEILQRVVPEDSDYQALNRFVKSKCKDHRLEVPEDLQCRTGRQEILRRKRRQNHDKRRSHSVGRDEKVDLLHEKLSQGPVGISYCANILKDEDFDGISFFGTSKAQCQNHSSVVIGRREKNGKCQLLIRDSTPINNCALLRGQDECQRNHKWIDEESLKKNLFEIQFIDKP